MSNDSQEQMQLGPVDFLIVEFPGSRMSGEGLPLLVDLVERGVIRILDLVFLRRNADASLRPLAPSELSEEAVVDLSVFEGASSGLVHTDDLARVGEVIAPGSSAAVLVYENTWAGPLATALRRGGAELVGSGRIPAQQLISALEE